jgi:hypothetical protein
VTDVAVTTNQNGSWKSDPRSIEALRMSAPIANENRVAYFDFLGIKRLKEQALAFRSY